MKECAKYDYIINSREFKVFARNNGEIDKTLNAMPKQTPMQTLEKYRLNFKVADIEDPEELAQYQKVIANFQKFMKTAASTLQIQKQQLKRMA